MPIDLVINDDVYFTEEFKVIVRSCKEKLLETARELALTDRSFMFAHRNNFHTFLRGIGIDERLIWPTAFINDILIPSEDFMNRTSIYIANIEDLDKLLVQLRTIRKNA